MASAGACYVPAVDPEPTSDALDRAVRAFGRERRYPVSSGWREN